MPFKPLPIGVDNFEEIIRSGYYYVDKTMFIKELVDLKGKVNLFTRPRRFGKTLGLSTIQYFFENTGSDIKNKEYQALFTGLQIMEMGEAYTSRMNCYPVISLSLKSSKQPDWSLAYGCLKEEISREYLRHSGILNFLKTTEQRRRFEDIMNLQGSPQDYVTSIRFLSDCLYEYWNQKVIILIDEYDVPLENSYFAGFYDKMIDFIRSVFESALKTNPGLEFAAMTGCLRISRESIFTGLNNLEIISVLSTSYSEHFGFTEPETQELLRFYGREAHMDTVRKWYDGYQFGDTEVYNPWSVLNYAKALYVDPKAFPCPYWSNTSSNTVVKDLIQRADAVVKEEIETLIAGGRITKPVHEDITYGDIYQSKDNLWNFLFFTGYLKQTKRWMEGKVQMVEMAIPNDEVGYIYENTIRNWFRDEMVVRDLSVLYQALLHGDCGVFQEELTKLLRESISYTDSKEAFYHGFLLGILGNMREYLVKSNREAGDGRYDICVRSLDISQAPAVLELKVSETFKGLEGSCLQALHQIYDRNYDDVLPEEGYTEVLNYGIAFFRKQCKVKVERRSF